jgi:hypothetical protein
VTIQAIETRYAGHHFRSRLEARWAVFFNALGIKWEYEPQGYTVGPNKIPYLPDFYLPDLKVAVEVKGDSERLSLNLLADFLEGSRDAHTVLVLGSIPKEEQRGTPTHLLLYRAFDIRPDPITVERINEFGPVIDKLDAEDRNIVNRFARDRGRPTIAMTQAAFFYGKAPFISPLGIMPSLPNTGVIEPLSPPIMPTLPYPKIQAAYEAARTARFEHGETPVPA